MSLDGVDDDRRIRSGVRAIARLSRARTSTHPPTSRPAPVKGDPPNSPRSRCPS
ncbi:hypothetical protein BGW80DRAFT_1323442 [Lactifluus volemus]|nr:hypothetical protein BGW80DRAFT_1323442 [Lactifluus volemus]